MIDSFAGPHEFLSNFYPREIHMAGTSFASNEHAYQAFKTLDAREFEWVRDSRSPGEAKRRGKQVTMRKDWEQVKIPVMYAVCRRKFRHRDLAERLVATDPHELVEGNWWYDRFWGVCQGQGENHLGRILMRLREEISGTNLV